MAQYDSSKKYTWTPEDTFTLTGSEFGLFLNTVRAYLSSEEAARFQLMMQANQVIEKVMIACNRGKYNNNEQLFAKFF